jgi:two-component system OmpR family sensor kinase
MSFRTRLTLLYAMITGGMLLIFGILIYFLIDTIISQQINSTLVDTYDSVTAHFTVDPTGRVLLGQLANDGISAPVYAQVWNNEGQLNSASRDIEWLQGPLDPANVSSRRTTFREVILAGVHMRVLTRPYQLEGRTLAVVQIATTLIIVDLVKRAMLIVLISATVLFTLVSAAAAWASLGQILIPLRTATATANQIVHADDLSRRIPYSGRPDEVGQLIEAFNSTLARVERLFNAQQRFMQDVSHELRTPLTVIKGNVDLIRKMGADPESLDSITQEADRLRRLVDDLLMLARAEAGRLPITLKPVDLDGVLLEVFGEMQVLAGDKVQLKVTEIDQAEVNGDRDRLKQVFINLISNAIKYTPQGGLVTVSLTKGPEKVRVSIRDTGPGIPAKDIPQIFDRFYRAERSRTRARAGGYGLGLSIANWIVEKHGGQIEVDSVEGQGSTFAVVLPLTR